MPESTLTTVYQYYDRTGHVLYVGVTSRETKRQQEHAETKIWWPLATGCGLEHFATRDEALARERQLIERYCPPYNTVHNKHKQAALASAEARAQASQSAKTPGRLSALRARRDAWYQLSPQDRLTATCVRCNSRPSGTRGPECHVCRPTRSRVSRDAGPVALRRTPAGETT